MGLNGKRFSVLSFDLVSGFFHFTDHFRHPLLKFTDRHCIARMERQCNHTFYTGKINLDQSIIVRPCLRLHFAVSVTASVTYQKFFCLFISTPDTGKCCTLGCHDINSHSVFHAQIEYPVSDKLQYLILIKVILEGCRNQGKRYILRSYTRSWRSGELHSQNRRISNIISTAKQLFRYFTAAFSNSHCAKCTIAGMTVRTKDHSAAACHHLTHILMKHRPVWRDKNTAIFFRVSKAEYMIILIDRSPHRTERMVAV